MSKKHYQKAIESLAQRITEHQDNCDEDFQTLIIEEMENLPDDQD